MTKRILKQVLRGIYYRFPIKYRSRLLNITIKLYPALLASQQHPINNFCTSSNTDDDILVNITDISGSLAQMPEKVAIHCHIFYTDLLDEFYRQLAQMPFPFDLFVSVTSEEAKQLCQQQLSVISELQTLQIVVVPNKGRDIAPMFCTFGAQLKNYSYIAHLHSKKSLYNSGATQGWREYLFHGLFGSSSNIYRIFNLFEVNGIGIIYSQCYSLVPYLAFTWLANSQLGSTLCKRLNINKPEHYFNYPAGSMFWARVDALRPLFDLNLSWNDFPEEKGQTDGTLAHAIERLLGIVPTAQGYETRIVKDIHLPSWSTFRLDQQYLCRNIDYYINAFNNDLTEIVAFDIFDTLLTRPLLHPDHTKQLIANQLDESNALLFLQYRTQAEINARHNMAKDVNLDTIYQEFTALTQLPPQIVSSIQLLEEQIEISSVRARDEMLTVLQFAKQFGKRILLISDMFLPRTVIEKMLSLNNVQGWDDIYLSSEQGVRKDTGLLYSLILEKEKVSGPQVVMIGDNERSDWQLPFDMFGIRCIHVMRANELAYALPSYKPLISSATNLSAELTLGLVIQRNLNKIACFETSDTQIVSDTPEKLGFNIIGPLVLGFCHWLLQSAMNDGIQQLYFLAREGEILKRVYDIWTEGTKDAPQSHYLQLSRRAVNVPQIQSFDSIKAIAEMHYFTNELSYFLYERFGLELSGQQWESIYKQGLWSPQQKLEIQQNNITHIIPLLRFLQPLILEKAAAEKEALLRYLASMNLFDDSQKKAVVDIGYSATIQKSLNQLLVMPLHGYYLATSAYVRKGIPAHLLTKGCYVSEGISNFPDSHVYSHNFMLEKLLSADSAQLTHYTVDNQTNKIHPHYKLLREKELSTQSVRAALQKGILDYAVRAKRIQKELYPEFTPDITIANSLYSEFIHHNSKYGNNTLKKMILDDDYCGRGLVE